MNIINSIPIIAVLLSAAAGRADAQGEPCSVDPTCPGAVWEAPIATPVNLNVYNLCGVGCQAIVTWRHRDACGSCDIAVQEIRPAAGSGCSCSVADLFKEAIASLLVLNPSPIPCKPDLPSECATVWRVMSGGCWEPDNRYVGGAVSCPGASCCLATYEVCLTAGGRTFRQTSPPGMQFPCEGAVPDPECVEVCNALPKSNVDPN